MPEAIFKTYGGFSENHVFFGQGRGESSLEKKQLRCKEKQLRDLMLEKEKQLRDVRNQEESLGKEVNHSRKFHITNSELLSCY